jgi:uncharacterized protein (TIGR03118 family)
MKPTLKNFSRLISLVLCFSITLISCQKTIQPADKSSQPSVAGKDPKSLKDFVQVNLVGSNDEYNPARIDPTISNAWGIAFNGPTGSIAWVNTLNSHRSNLLNTEGIANAGRPFVGIPSPTGAANGLPTGIVFANISGQFLLPPGPNTTSTTPAPAIFIFVGVDGVLSAWNGTYTNAFRVFAHGFSAYTGLAIGNSAGNNFIYLANFASGHIEVYNKDWNSVSMSFTDPDLPAGYSPFNIQNVGGLLYVMYAKVNPEEHEEEAGPGLGFVDIYNTNGALVKRFVSKGQLNAPWGVAQVPAGFFGSDDAQSAILIGNFGDGHINAYSTDGEFLGQLRQSGNPIEIEGLWAIVYHTPTGRLFFAAGPDDEEQGLFGYISK